MTSSPYDIVWAPTARRQLEKLPEKVGTAIVEFAYSALAANPQRVGKPLKLGLEGSHSARRGDYRVIYRVSEAERAVEITAVEHRADVYRHR